MKPYLKDIFISIHVQQIMTHSIISPFMYDWRNLFKQVQTIEKVKIKSWKMEKL